MVTGCPVLVKIVIQSESEIGKGAPRRTVFDPDDLLRRDGGHADMGIFDNVGFIVENKRRFQGVAVCQTTDKSGNNNHRY